MVLYYVFFEARAKVQMKLTGKSFSDVITSYYHTSLKKLKFFSGVDISALPLSRMMAAPLGPKERTYLLGLS